MPHRPSAKLCNWITPLIVSLPNFSDVPIFHCLTVPKLQYVPLLHLCAASLCCGFIMLLTHFLISPLNHCPLPPSLLSHCFATLLTHKFPLSLCLTVAHYFPPCDPFSTSLLTQNFMFVQLSNLDDYYPLTVSQLIASQSNSFTVSLSDSFIFSLLTLAKRSVTIHHCYTVLMHSASLSPAV